ncbi:4-amino-4-deoxy-L-arabinose-phosphoundecaprenol flippase subunit ArnE [Enterobacter sp. DTU_2021_1002640_1_SI_PRY_ASU_LCPMC_013]|uniref:4-amino-4-deoxy-L-arabinose-phosphoundecaprenol flippase subunit ArnE n=1 Tax=Enterobacter sp. DTU_2021_1002640_1_SI_PRY_ASU_LCPMC_013 TaxID=3077940 RepID=UPI0027E6DB5F|nr:4-amino-4-deoxy-L-arabinose-phosphoundecaprenol flippase subunit ArnE [Enterobacter sp. DTU_2021_1002640_1_SI_PRY_ASU_LCPMC_013]EKY3917457.1 4-amino-4-deoxy-L-arabinose-phosphoundecaprenol flippase subunit ArnE [Enterobacter hormaechei]WNU99073.1 4-amino-4-deoxy-L-arabinose-phosphoundecaprenol flippase subunit ArnE [Enterobacter sp. DTU_2021_1002640_1_SI_PRY_ASU_LCPMC_013]
MNLCGILTVSLLTCMGQVCQKIAASPQDKSQRYHAIKWLLIAVILLSFGMVVWLWVLQTTPVSLAYPMLSLNFIWVTLAAKIIWKEVVTVRHWTGIMFIIGGVIMLGGYQ